MEVDKERVRARVDLLPNKYKTVRENTLLQKKFHAFNITIQTREKTANQYSVLTL
jgi:hypothetical protein